MRGECENCGNEDELTDVEHKDSNTGAEVCATCLPGYVKEGFTGTWGPISPAQFGRK